MDHSSTLTLCACKAVCLINSRWGGQEKMMLRVNAEICHNRSFCVEAGAAFRACAGEQMRPKKLEVLNFLMAARWFSLTPPRCYLIHVCLRFWISIPELDEWVMLSQRGRNHNRKRAGAGWRSQPDASLLYESASSQEAVPTFGFAA